MPIRCHKPLVYSQATAGCATKITLPTLMTLRSSSWTFIFLKVMSQENQFYQCSEEFSSVELLVGCNCTLYQQWGTFDPSVGTNKEKGMARRKTNQRRKSGKMGKYNQNKMKGPVYKVFEKTWYSMLLVWQRVSFWQEGFLTNGSTPWQLTSS